jgi:hypothetical protein
LILYLEFYEGNNGGDYFFKTVYVIFAQDYVDLREREYQNEVTTELKGEISAERREATDKARKVPL